ncbi:Hypothetical predicted protein [Podarcis lilfordi]|uniref:Uncharacterized protein n=1 Tax=Podarcis lilfordi TaxID=74358 RepID=A0AA35LJW8_9SAUR|nr:Hypothetical predicted protein [Podarcis lilfordi]
MMCGCDPCHHLHHPAEPFSRHLCGVGPQDAECRLLSSSKLPPSLPELMSSLVGGSWSFSPQRGGVSPDKQRDLMRTSVLTGRALLKMRERNGGREEASQLLLLTATKKQNKTQERRLPTHHTFKAHGFPQRILGAVDYPLQFPAPLTTSSSQNSLGEVMCFKCAQVSISTTKELLRNWVVLKGNQNVGSILRRVR